MPALGAVSALRRLHFEADLLLLRVSRPQSNNLQKRLRLSHCHMQNEQQDCHKTKRSFVVLGWRAWTSRHKPCLMSVFFSLKIS